MPQALPANPELDGLKKAANKRLAELRGRAPEAKLHQAQFAIATDYGFTSWRTLKAHIALHLAVSKNNTTALRRPLAHGVAVNAKRTMWDCNHTALHMTVENGAIDIARQLLDAGADPNIRDDKFGATALGWAEFFGRPDFAELVRARGGV